MKGLIANVYRAENYNCTNGVTSYCNSVLLVGNGIPELFEADGMPVLKVVRRNIVGREHIHAEPIEATRGNRMFGGNFVYTSDGRFPSPYPIPVHDRVEENSYETD